MEKKYERLYYDLNVFVDHEMGRLFHSGEITVSHFRGAKESRELFWKVSNRLAREYEGMEVEMDADLLTIKIK